ncbi:MAG: hypothetical protein Ct9H300mP28_29890 [Pseudomonadota bacterium]|nr:MAG: hypothetical protein Ct9H300mP28_29890 [Pseudomonadota bacterium]
MTEYYKRYTNPNLFLFTMLKKNALKADMVRKAPAMAIRELPNITATFFDSNHIHSLSLTAEGFSPVVLTASPKGVR